MTAWRPFLVTRSSRAPLFYSSTDVTLEDKVVLTAGQATADLLPPGSRQCTRHLHPGNGGAADGLACSSGRSDEEEDEGDGTRCFAGSGWFGL